MKYLVSLVVMISALFSSVDINNANAESFSTLKGIGAKKAQRIVAFRDTHGCFSRIAELSKVKGIGSKTIEKNKTELVLGECKK